MRILEGYTALVTGATRGIGFAIARAYLEAGARVFITGTSEQTLRPALSRLEDIALAERGKQAGPQVAGCLADVREQESVDRMLVEALGKFPQIDILVNNAGRGGGGSTLSTDPDTWYDIINTNLNGVYRVTMTVLQEGGMLSRRWGRIINIASTGGKQGVVYAAAYTASKHGVVGFSKSLGLELAKSGVTVNAICPGFVETDLAVQARQHYAQVWSITPEEVLGRFEARIPLGRYVTPDEVAGLAVYLASASATPVIGQAINVCGGLGNY
jgi:ketoreductase